MWTQSSQGDTCAISTTHMAIQVAFVGLDWGVELLVLEGNWGPTPPRVLQTIGSCAIEKPGPSLVHVVLDKVGQGCDRSFDGA